ncbi:hypothetical protein V6N11_040249 [Hibiscus sabdariffa]|uniref:Uncharacterized protein n=1 Tax=Hibiscus sabdariffa TaxID=183260 RepID=A0ABR2RGX2_9ROSI
MGPFYRQRRGGVVALEVENWGQCANFSLVFLGALNFASLCQKEKLNFSSDLVDLDLPGLAVFMATGKSTQVRQGKRLLGLRKWQQEVNCPLSKSKFLSTQLPIDIDSEKKRKQFEF